jgi:hypothetical protein
VPGTVALQLDNHPPSYDRLLVHIVILAALYCLLMLLLLRLRNRDELRERAQRNQAEETKEPFDFRKAFVSALTTAGVLLGTALTAGVLPADTFFISKEQYASLNVLFGLIVVFAGLIYNASTKRITLIRVAAVTLGAAFGEVLTMVFILREMAIQASLPWIVVLVMQILLVGISVPVSISAIRKVSEPLGTSDPNHAI